MPTSRQRRVLAHALAAAVVLPLAARGAEPGTLQEIEDLARLREQSRRERVPVLLFFSTPGCPYCLDVRRNYLAPRVRQGKAAGILVREIDITSRRTFAGHDGKPVSEMELAGRFNVRVAPVVVLVDGDLTPLVDPLVGIDRAGFYESFLSSAIEAAQSKLRQ